MILLVVQPQCLQALLSEEMVPVSAVTIRYRFRRERVFLGGEDGVRFKKYIRLSNE